MFDMYIPATYHAYTTHRRVASDTAKELQLEFHALWMASTSCGRNQRKLHGSFYLKCGAAMEARKPLNKSSWIRGSNTVMVSFCSKGSDLKTSNLSSCTAGARKDLESHILLKKL